MPAVKHETKAPVADETDGGVVNIDELRRHEAMDLAIEASKPGVQMDDLVAAAKAIEAYLKG